MQYISCRRRRRAAERQQLTTARPRAFGKHDHFEALAQSLHGFVDDPTPYETWVERIRQTAVRSNKIRFMAVVENNLADILEKRGEIEPAILALQRAAAHMDRAGLNSYAPRLNIAKILLIGGRHSDTVPDLRRLVRLASDQHHARWLAASRVLLTEALLGSGLTQEAVDCFALADQGLQETGLVVPDVALSLQRALQLGPPDALARAIASRCRQSYLTLKWDHRLNEIAPCPTRP